MNINVIQARPFQLAEPIGTTDTEITVKNLFDIYGNPIVMSGDVQYSTVEPQSQTNQEIISYTGIVQLTTTTSKLTGITRGLDAQPDPVTGLYGSDPSQAKAHSANAECILSDNPQVWDKKTSKDEEETISEEWTFQKSPIVPTPTQDDQAATKEYADTLAILGGTDASTTAKGIARLTASPNITLGTFTVTIATPAVFTKATHGLTENDTVQFTTDGALPTGLLPSVTYYVIATGLTANDFQVSATYGGSAVATSGSQSGTHTVIRTTPRAVGENDTRLPTQDENNAIAGKSGTPVSASNPLIDEAYLPTAVPQYPNIDTTYPAGETLSAGNVVFIENAPTTAQATSAQNIGDVTANTRISFPVFGSGTAGATLALNLAKNGSPSVNLGVRIETDNAGIPSGTLVNANATGTVAAASLTTSLADTTVTLGGSITIPAGQKCHIVTFQGTYGSETVNASNYYKVGYYTKDSTTRGQKLWNGSVHAAMQTAIVPYTSSTLFQPRVLSKTDADFSYKIDWHGITQEAVTAGDLTTGKFPKVAVSGIDSNQTGMTQGTTMMISNTPGAIIGTDPSTIPTYSAIIGEAKSDSKLLLATKRKIITPSTNYKLFLNTSRDGDGTSTPLKVKELMIGYSGGVTVSFELNEAGSDNAVAQIYVNGLARGTQRSIITTWTTFVENISVNAGDLIQLYVWDTGSSTASVRNFKVGYDFSYATIGNMLITD